MFALGLSLLLAVAPAPAPSCAAPVNVPVVKYSPPVSTLVAQSQMHGLVTMVVTLPAGDGRPTNVALSSSSGSDFLDQAALAQARISQFTPEVHDCAPVGGQYFYTIEF
jgi:TonB family protein